MAAPHQLLTRGERLRLARERSGLGVNEFALAVGMHRNNISRWEGRRGPRPTEATAQLYADVCGNATVEWLMYEIGEWPSKDATPTGGGHSVTRRYRPTLLAAA